MIFNSLVFFSNFFGCNQVYSYRGGGGGGGGGGYNSFSLAFWLNDSLSVRSLNDFNWIIFYTCNIQFAQILLLVFWMQSSLFIYWEDNTFSLAFQLN